MRDITGDTRDSILDCVGSTPMVRLSRVAADLQRPILGKCEFLNPGGSLKDRIAVAIVDAAEEEGLLRPGGTLIEATAGNTGIGLALVAARRGYRLVCVMPEKMSVDKRESLRALGAEVLVTDNAPPSDPRNFQQVAKRLAAETDNALWTNQFANLANPRIHERTTGPEIWHQTGGAISAFVTGVGTGGSITGIGRYLKRMNPEVKIILADPVGSGLAGLVNEGELGPDGRYEIEGIGSSVVPEVFDPTVVDMAVSVTDAESFAMTHRLVREEGLLVGGSSGTTVAAACQAAGMVSGDGPIVALLQDSWDRYRSKIFNPAWLASR